MANYKNTKLRNSDSGTYNRTSSYRFTIENKSDPELANLKLSVREYNKQVKRYPWLGEPKRVMLMGRGPRRKSDGSMIHPNCDSNLRHKYATHFDVYVQDVA